MSIQTGYDEASFSSDVILKWGAICEHLAEDKGLLHPQMSWLAHICETYPQHREPIFDFLEHLLRNTATISEIENAIAISFLDWKQLQSYDLQRSSFSNVFRVVLSQHERG